MDPALQLKWASLAQMAGEMDVACAILGEINRRDPDMVGAWRQHLELLHILNRTKDAARVSVDGKTTCG